MAIWKVIWGPFFGAGMAGPVTLYITQREHGAARYFNNMHVSLSLQEMPFGEVVGGPQSCLSFDLFMEILIGNYP